MYNKRKFNKINDKKVLHKVRKQWATISLSLLMLIGGGALATHTTASANVTNNNHQNQQQFNLKLGSRNSNNSSITNQAKSIHHTLINNAAKQSIKHSRIHKFNLVNRPLVNNHYAKRINSVNKLKTNQSGNYQKYIYKRINLPFWNIRINKPIRLHSSVNFDRSYTMGTLPKGDLIKVNRAFKEFGYYNNYLRYEVKLADKRNAFITGNKYFVSYVAPSKNYKYYQNRINYLLKHINNTNSVKLVKQFNRLNKQRKHSLNKYINLYKLVYNTQQRLKHPVIVNYHNKIAKINNKSKRVSHNNSRDIVPSSLANSSETTSNVSSTSSSNVNSVLGSNSVAPISLNIPSYTPTASSSSINVLPIPSSVVNSSISNSSSTSSNNQVNPSISSNTASESTSATSMNSNAQNKSVSSSSNSISNKASSINSNSSQSTSSMTPNSSSVIPSSSKTSQSSTNNSVDSKSTSNSTNSKSNQSTSSQAPSSATSTKPSSTTSSVASKSNSSISTPNENVSEITNTTLDDINKERAQNNVAPLSVNTDLQSIASMRANQLMTNFSHYNNKNQLYDNLDAEKVAPKFVDKIAENIAVSTLGPSYEEGKNNKGQSDQTSYNNKNGIDMANMMNDGMMNYDADQGNGHRKNILNNEYATIGVGTSYDSQSGRYYLAEDFSFLPNSSSSNSNSSNATNSLINDFTKDNKLAQSYVNEANADTKNSNLNLQSNYVSEANNYDILANNEASLVYNYSLTPNSDNLINANSAVQSASTDISNENNVVSEANSYANNPLRHHILSDINKILNYQNGIINDFNEPRVQADYTIESEIDNDNNSISSMTSGLRNNLSNPTSNITSSADSDVTSAKSLLNDANTLAPKAYHYVDANNSDEWSKITDWKQANKPYHGLNYKYAPNEKAVEFTSGTLNNSGLMLGATKQLGATFNVTESDIKNAKSIKFDKDIDTSKVTNMSGMFQSDSNLESLNLGPSFDTSNVTNMSGIFENDTSLKSLKLPESFRTPKVQDTSYMFTNDAALESLTLPQGFSTNTHTTQYQFTHAFAHGAKLVIESPDTLSIPHGDPLGGEVFAYYNPIVPHSDVNFSDSVEFYNSDNSDEPVKKGLAIDLYNCHNSNTTSHVGTWYLRPVSDVNELPLNDRKEVKSKCAQVNSDAQDVNHLTGLSYLPNNFVSNLTSKIEKHMPTFIPFFNYSDAHRLETSPEAVLDDVPEMSKMVSDVSHEISTSAKIPLHQAHIAVVNSLESSIYGQPIDKSQTDSPMMHNIASAAGKSAAITVTGIILAHVTGAILGSLFGPEGTVAGGTFGATDHENYAYKYINKLSQNTVDDLSKGDSLSDTTKDDIKNLNSDVKSDIKKNIEDALDTYCEWYIEDYHDNQYGDVFNFHKAPFIKTGETPSMYKLTSHCGNFTVLPKEFIQDLKVNQKPLIADAISLFGMHKYYTFPKK